MNFYVKEFICKKQNMLFAAVFFEKKSIRKQTFLPFAD